MARSNWIRFDWAMKRLLRQKSNFVVLEGFLTCLLGRQVTIVEILESEGNKRDAEDKFNRVDILATDDQKEKFIIEIQNNRELDYFHRMLYGVSRVILDFLHEGAPYSEIRKVYSVNIVYFDLGQGRDYVYYGHTDFEGIHEHDLLRLSSIQQKQFMLATASDVFPEYYVLRVNEFDRLAKTPLDEWIKFLKTGEIDSDMSAPGLPEARERLRRDKLSPEEQRDYDNEIERLRYQQSVLDTSRIEGREEGREEGRQEGLQEGHKKAQLTIARNLLAMGMSPAEVAKVTGLTPEELN